MDNKKQEFYIISAYIKENGKDRVLSELSDKYAIFDYNLPDFKLLISGGKFNQYKWRKSDSAIEEINDDARFYDFETAIKCAYQIMEHIEPEVENIHFYKVKENQLSTYIDDELIDKFDIITYENTYIVLVRSGPDINLILE